MMIASVILRQPENVNRNDFAELSHLENLSAGLCGFCGKISTDTEGSDRLSDYGCRLLPLPPCGDCDCFYPAGSDELRPLFTFPSDNNG